MYKTCIKKKDLYYTKPPGSFLYNYFTDEKILTLNFSLKENCNNITSYLGLV